MLNPYRTPGLRQLFSQPPARSIRFSGVYPTKEMMDQAEKGASYTKIENKSEGRVAYITDQELNVRTQLWKAAKHKQTNINWSEILTELWRLIIKNKDKQPNWGLKDPALMQFWDALVENTAEKKNNQQSVAPQEAHDYLSQFEGLLIEHASAIADKSVKALD